VLLAKKLDWVEVYTLSIKIEATEVLESNSLKEAMRQTD